MRRWRRGLFMVVLGTVAAALSACGGGGGGGGGTSTVLERASAKVGADGGEVTLSDGTRVVFPAGAVSEEVEVTVSKLAPEALEDQPVDPGVERVVLECEPSGTFGAEVEIHVPMPGEVADALDPALAREGVEWIAWAVDEETGALEYVPSELAAGEAGAEVVIRTDHFSMFVTDAVLREVLDDVDLTDLIRQNGAIPLPDSRLLEPVPYYNQGDTKYCWATSLQMLCEAMSPSRYLETFDIIGALGVDEGGLYIVEARLSRELGTYLSVRTGVAPERALWQFDVNTDALFDYIRRQVGIFRRPVAILSGPKSHAWLIVGYDASGNLIVHDPKSINYSAIGYQKVPASDLGFGWMMGASSFATIVLPTAMDADRPQVTVNIPNGGVQFVKPADDAGSSDIYEFRWNYRVREGYAIWSQKNTEFLSDPMPSGISEIKPSLDTVEVVNAGDASVDLTIDVTVSSTRPDTPYYKKTYTLTVGANELKKLNFDAIPAEEFLEVTETSQAEPTEYNFTVWVYDAATSKLFDQAGFRFTLGPVAAEPHINEVTPDPVEAGQEIVIKGTGFGEPDWRSDVYLNGDSVDAESWGPTEIRVVVPEDAPSTVTVMVEVFDPVQGEYVQSNEATVTVVRVPTPVITSISPETVEAGGTVTIEGTGFGDQRGSVATADLSTGWVGNIVSWSDTRITFEVPEDEPAGEYEIRVGVFYVNMEGYDDIAYSNTVTLTVTAADEEPEPEPEPEGGPEITATSQTLNRSPLIEPGEGFAIYGTGFGSEVGRVVIGSEEVEVEHWQDDYIAISIPAGLPPETEIVVYTASGLASDPFDLRVGALPWIREKTKFRLELSLPLNEDSLYWEDVYSYKVFENGSLYTSWTDIRKRFEIVVENDGSWPMEWSDTTLTTYGKYRLHPPYTLDDPFVVVKVVVTFGQYGDSVNLIELTYDAAKSTEAGLTSMVPRELYHKIEGEVSFGSGHYVDEDVFDLYFGGGDECWSSPVNVVSAVEEVDAEVSATRQIWWRLEADPLGSRYVCGSEMEFW